MRPGDRVRVVAPWSSFKDQRGELVTTEPHVMVRIDGDSYPIRMGRGEVVREPEEVLTFTGAE